VETAIGKARTAVGFKRPTRVLEEMINNGRTAFLSIPGEMVFLQGGVPIRIDGEIVGAIGVSGVKAADDEVVAQAGSRRPGGLTPIQRPLRSAKYRSHRPPSRRLEQ
jgi:glc operon protein GlcG